MQTNAKVGCERWSEQRFFAVDMMTSYYNMGLFAIAFSDSQLVIVPVDTELITDRKIGMFCVCHVRIELLSYFSNFQLL